MHNGRVCWLPVLDLMDQIDCTVLEIGYALAEDAPGVPVYWMHYELVAELHDCSFDMEPAIQTPSVVGTYRLGHRSPVVKSLLAIHQLVY